MTNIFEPVKDNYENLNDEEISQLETILNCRFPEDYRDFLSQYGRCMFSGEAIVKDEGGNELEVFTMFGGKGEAGNIKKDSDLHPEYTQDRLIPIADDMFDNRFVLHVETGKVGFIDYSSGAATYTHVAKSFEEFVKKIEVVPDEE